VYCVACHCAALPERDDSRATPSDDGDREIGPNALLLDADAMLDDLRAWVECESPTYDDAVNRMMDIASRDLVITGARIEQIVGRMGFGDCVRASFPHATPNEPSILVMGHLDTVHLIGSPAELAFQREGGKTWGSGICYMEGGNCLALEVIRQLGRAHVAIRLLVTMLLTSDEEAGSPSTRDLIEAEASRHRYVLAPEPARANGGVVTERYAIARFNLEATGRPSNAGARLAERRSATREMARKIVEVEDMTTDDCTFSVGVINGGQQVNCVSTTCTGETLSMAKRQEDLDRGVAAMLGLRASGNDVAFRVMRPEWKSNPRGMALHSVARDVARGLGFDIPHQSSGGGPGGNFTGAMGVATLDRLGIQGAGPHTLNEHILVDSLAHRGKLFAGILAVLS
jgi:glutamate carboxypeptidase